MKQQTIKKGRKSIIHLPKFKKEKIIYRQRIAISHTMRMVNDDCDSGWSKLWGIAFGHHHLHSSYRFVFRVKNGRLLLGYYAYCNGRSPQDYKHQKGKFDTFIDAASREIYRMEIVVLNNGVRLQLFNETKGIPFMSPILEKPKSFKWLRTELYPNLKCKQNQDTNFPFLNYY